MYYLNLCKIDGNGIIIIFLNIIIVLVFIYEMCFEDWIRIFWKFGFY